MSKYHRAIMGRVVRFMRTIFIARRKRIDLYFPAVSGSLPVSSPAIRGAQTLLELRGIAAKWNIAYTLFDLLALHTRRSARVSLYVQPDLAITLPPKSTEFTALRSINEHVEAKGRSQQLFVL